MDDLVPTEEVCPECSGGLRQREELTIRDVRGARDGSFRLTIYCTVCPYRREERPVMAGVDQPMNELTSVAAQHYRQQAMDLRDALREAAGALESAGFTYSADKAWTAALIDGDPRD